MIAVATFALYAWIPVVVVLFLVLPRRTALLTAFVAGWLFLPEKNIRMPGLPDLSKVNVTSFGPLLAAVLLDAGRVFRFRPGWRDLPVAALCICPFFSSLANGLGAHDGVSSIVTYFGIWGVPYLLGRIYLCDDAGLTALARTIVAGGLIYVPLCLFEIRMSPQLHLMIYGFHPHDFAQSARAGGWRPVVFMEHGLMVAFWMAAAALLGLILTRARIVRILFGIPAGWCCAALVLTLLLCKSAGALGLFVAGWLVTWLARRRNAAPFMYVLLLLAPLYITGRVSGAIDRASVDKVFSPLPAERIESLDFRLKNEDPLVARALLEPLWGWGGWGRSRLVDEEGVDITTADSLWIVYLGRNGIVGLVAVFALLLIGPFTFLQRFPPSRWLRPEHAPAFGVALMVILFALDCTMNAMVNPVYILATGALVSLPRPRPAKAAAPSPFAPLTPA